MQSLPINVNVQNVKHNNLSELENNLLIQITELQDSLFSKEEELVKIMKYRKRLSFINSKQ